MSVLWAQFRAVLRLHPVIAGSLLLALLAGAANYPLWQRREVATREHEAVRRQGETMLAALTDRGRINADVALLTDAGEWIDRNLASEEGMEANLGYFYRLEKVNKVRLIRLDQLAAPLPEENSPFKTVPVSLQISGSYRNALGFLRDLESGPRILRLRSYRLERTDPGGNEVGLFLTLDLLAQP